MPKEYVIITVSEVKVETNGAFLFKMENGSEHWVPKSQIEEPDEGIGKGETDIEVSVEKWFADREEIPY